MFRAMDNLPLPYNNYRVWLQKRWSAVVIQRHVRGMLARMNVESMHMNAYDGSPSLLEDGSSASTTSFACAAILQLSHKISATPVESSGSSFSTSQSLWEKGFYLPMEEAGSIPTTVTVARNSLMKSNPVTQSSPRQRQAK
jgi:hypothetical protein